jgi:hypothetical protein
MAKEGQANHLQRSEQNEVVMLRYFFHFHSGSVITSDIEGTEFSSLEAAIAEAQRARLEIMADGAIGCREYRFEIADQNGRIVATVPFKHF